MSGLPQGFVFDRYALRPAVAQDRSLALAWMEADPFHAGKFTADFWVEQVSGRVSSFVLEDAQPIFFFRLEMNTRQGVEIYIQFSPDNHMRTMRALKVGWEWLKKRLTWLGYGIVSFRSMNPPLVNFFKAQGFEHSGDTLWYVLQPRVNGATEAGNDVRTDTAAN